MDLQDSRTDLFSNSYRKYQLSPFTKKKERCCSNWAHLSQGDCIDTTNTASILYLKLVSNVEANSPRHLRRNDPSCLSEYLPPWEEWCPGDTSRLLQQLSQCGPEASYHLEHESDKAAQTKGFRYLSNRTWRTSGPGAKCGLPGLMLETPQPQPSRPHTSFSRPCPSPTQLCTLLECKVFAWLEWAQELCPYGWRTKRRVSSLVRN